MANLAIATRENVTARSATSLTPPPPTAMPIHAPCFLSTPHTHTYSSTLVHPHSRSPSNPASIFPIMASESASEYVTLVSNDGYEFKLLRSAACIAGTIKKALDPMCT